MLADLAAGESLRLAKYVAYHWAAQAAAGDLLARVGRTLDRAAAIGYDAIEDDHGAHVADVLAALATSSSTARPTCSGRCASTSSS